MPIEEFLLRYWPLIIAAVAVIIWAIRMEGRIGKADTGIRALWKQREEDQRTASTSRGEVHEALTELRRDVKDILKALGERK